MWKTRRFTHIVQSDADVTQLKFMALQAELLKGFRGIAGTPTTAEHKERSIYRCFDGNLSRISELVKELVAAKDAIPRIRRHQPTAFSLPTAVLLTSSHSRIVSSHLRLVY